MMTKEKLRQPSLPSCTASRCRKGTRLTRLERVRYELRQKIALQPGIITISVPLSGGHCTFYSTTLVQRAVISPSS